MADEETSFLPEIQYLVFRECTPEWRLKPHESSCYDMTYLIDGAARYTIDGVHHEVSAGDLVCLREGMRKEARTYPGRLMRCFSVNFLAINRHGESVYPPFPDVSHVDVKDDIIKLFQELVYTWRDQQAGYIIKSQGLLLLILHRFFELTVYKIDSAIGDCRIKMAIRYITQHFTERLTVEKLAELVNLNAAYFGALFKRETGVSVSRYVANTRVRNAENMLRSGAYRVAEVADLCGYNDMFHFYKQFKAIIGVPPSRCIPISTSRVDTRKTHLL
ncbi:MAG: AraC family transcriptional regulator [Treponema sp.]|jgi:AraC-like DNA-binding protein|nr:AraC family transcriptional regulator [Treponema sp.]